MSLAEGNEVFALQTFMNRLANEGAVSDIVNVVGKVHERLRAEAEEKHRGEDKFLVGKCISTFLPY